jgi:hypothetical protein
MTEKQASPKRTFADEFLKHYLKNGIGSMSKSDIDALVMYLLDTFSHEKGVPLRGYSNQVLSLTLRAPLSKIKRLRYESGLKFGGRAEDEAKRRLISCLSTAAMELDDTQKNVTKICLIIEDSLAKHWIQGQLKEYGYIFDGSFNSEIIRVSPEGFFFVLGKLLDAKDVAPFEAAYKTLLDKKRGKELISGFGKIVKAFATEAVKAVLQAGAERVGLPAF